MSEITQLYFGIPFVLLPLNILSNNFVDKNVDREKIVLKAQILKLHILCNQGTKNSSVTSAAI